MISKEVHPKSIVVFIHGIKGSVLVDEKDSTVWLSGTQGLGLSTPNIALPLTWQNDVQEKDSIRAKEVLSDVKVIPFILEEKVYSPWLTAGRELYKENFHPFAYDWRRDNLESVESFEMFVGKIRSANPEASITIVAHSMGGLIALALLNKRPEFFQKLSNSFLLLYSPHSRDLALEKRIEILINLNLGSRFRKRVCQRVE
jgi:pimeloyl-ACP methyl ester carboxylesterase